MKKLIVALAAVAVLGGCMKVSKDPPKDLPDYVTVMPGGQQMMTMNMGALSSEVFTTTSTPDDVLAYYRSQAQSNGLTENTTAAPANANAAQKQATFGDAASGKFLVVVAQPQQSMTMVSLTYKPAPKAAS